jgi:hypothetical protein
MSSVETPTETTKKKKISAPEAKTCGNCGGAEGSAAVAKLSACVWCGLVVYEKESTKITSVLNCPASAREALRVSVLNTLITRQKQVSQLFLSGAFREAASVRE